MQRITKAVVPDRKGDIELIRPNPPQVRAKNQNGHPRPKDLQADERAQWEYSGSNADEFVPSWARPAKRADRDGTGIVFYFPMGRTFDEKVRIPLATDKEVDMATSGNKYGQKPDGYVMGQKVGQFCPNCHIAPKLVRSDICDICGWDMTNPDIPVQTRPGQNKTDKSRKPVHKGGKRSDTRRTRKIRRIVANAKISGL